MSNKNINPQILNSLARCRSVALENLIFYEAIFESIKDGSDKDMIGRAMAQKQDFISAVDIILNPHDIQNSQMPATLAANDHSHLGINIFEDIRHLEHEDIFKDVVSQCLKLTEDKTLRQLLSHHLEASELAVNAIKSTSLIL